VDYCQKAVYVSCPPSTLLVVLDNFFRRGSNCYCHHLIWFLRHQLDLPSSPSSPFPSSSLQLLHSISNFQDSTSFPFIYATACVAHRRRLAVASTFVTITIAINQSTTLHYLLYPSSSPQLQNFSIFISSEGSLLPKPVACHPSSYIHRPSRRSLPQLIFTGLTSAHLHFDSCTISRRRICSLLFTFSWL